MYHAPVKGEGRERRDELGNFNKAYRTQPHRGSDWGFKTGSAGKPVYAVADGIVTDNFWTDALGHCITVKNTHDEVFVLFAHLEEKSPVKKGIKVIGGETELGKIGNTGSASAGAHLHAAASKSPKPHLASYPALLDLFKLIDADKPAKEVKPKTLPENQATPLPKKQATPKKAPVKKAAK